MKRLTLCLLVLAALPACDQKMGTSSSTTQAKEAGKDKNPVTVAEQLRKSGRNDQALLMLQDMYAKKPDDIAVATQYGYALIDAGRHEEAVGVFDKIITNAPDNALAYSGKGVAFDRAGNHLAAQELYQQALKLSPDSISIQNNMAMSLILNRQIEPAIALLEKLNMQNDNKTIRQNLALAYGIKGEKKRALELNLKDLPPEKANENLRFYEKYAAKLKSEGKVSNEVGFAETPSSQKEQLATLFGEKPEKPVKKKAKKKTTPLSDIVNKAPESPQEGPKALPKEEPKASPAAEVKPVAKESPAPAPESPKEVAKPEMPPAAASTPLASHPRKKGITILGATPLPTSSTPEAPQQSTPR